MSNIIVADGLALTTPQRMTATSGSITSFYLSSTSRRDGGQEHENKVMVICRDALADEVYDWLGKGDSIEVVGRVFIGHHGTPYTEVEAITVRPLVTREPEPEPEPEPTTYHFDVSVWGVGLTPEQAEQVMAERIGPDEDYGFPYRIGFTQKEDS